MKAQYMYKGKVSLNLCDVLQNYDLVRNNGIVSINDLKKGLYLVNILDKNYNILSSDKLIIE